MDCELCENRACCGVRIYKIDESFELKYCCPTHCPKYCNNKCLNCQKHQRKAIEALNKGIPLIQRVQDGSSTPLTNLRVRTTSTGVNSSLQTSSASTQASARMGPEDTSALQTVEAAVSTNSAGRRHGNDRQCPSVSNPPRARSPKPDRLLQQ